MVGRTAAFIDRDGVINRAFVRDGKPYPPQTLDEFSIYPDVAGAFSKLRAAGYLLIVATNQPDVLDGKQSRATVDAMHRELARVLSPDAIKVCWDRKAPCYKPQPGMIIETVAEFGIDIRSSWMIGDRWRDIACGRSAGCHTILIDRGYNEELLQAPEYTCADLAGAADIILAGRMSLR